MSQKSFEIFRRLNGLHSMMHVTSVVLALSMAYAGCIGGELSGISRDELLLDPSVCTENVDGIASLPTTSSHLCAADFDRDGWTDVVTTPLDAEQMAVQLWRNRTEDSPSIDWSDVAAQVEPRFEPGVVLVEPRGYFEPRATISCGDFTGDGNADVVYVSCAAANVGFEANDTLEGSPERDDVIRGCGGDDVIRGAPGRDDGQDFVTNDCLYGDEGNDRIGGKGGADELYGGPDDDTLFGDDGDDLLVGGLGADRYVGDVERGSATGADKFVIGVGLGPDTIVDFDGPEGDRIELRGTTYAELTLQRSGASTRVLQGTELIAVVERTTPAQLPESVFHTCPGDARCVRRCLPAARVGGCGSVEPDGACVISSVELVAGRGDGTFEPPRSAFAADPASLGALPWSGTNEVATDLDGDGDLDLLLGISSDGGGDVRVLLNDGGAFSQDAALISGLGLGARGATAIVYVDVTGDETPDLVVGSPSSTDIRIYDALPESTYQLVNPVGVGETYPGGATSLVVLDLDYDGSLDLVAFSDDANLAASEGGTVYVWLGNGSSTPFASGLTRIAASRGEPAFDFDVAVAIDYDRDPLGTLDLIVADGNAAGEAYVFANRPYATTPDGRRVAAVDCSPEPDDGGTPPPGSACDPTPILEDDFEGCGGNLISTPPPGWTMTGTVDWWLDSGLDGCGVDLTGSSAGAISRVLTTVPGQRYVVTFDARTNSLPTNPFRVSAAGQTAELQSTSERQAFRFEFVADAASTTLELSSPVEGVAGTFVDNVRVAPDCEEVCARAVVLEEDFEGCGGDVGNTAPTGWTLVSGLVDWWSSAGLDGCEVDLNGSPGFAGSEGRSGVGVIERAFATVPGTQYVVTLDAVSNGGGARPFRISAAGQSADLASSSVIESYRFGFIATEATTALRLEALSEGSFGAFVDNVRVVGGCQEACEPGAELIVNGDFDGDFLALDVLSGRAPAWTLEGARRRLFTATAPPRDGAIPGAFFAALDLGSQEGNAASQEFTLTPGRAYTLEFDVGESSSRPPTTEWDGIERFAVELGDAVFPFEWLASGAPRRELIELVATTARTTLRFRSTASSPYGAIIDNVSFRETCEEDSCLRPRDIVLAVDVQDRGIGSRSLEDAAAFLTTAPRSATVELVLFSADGVSRRAPVSRDAARETLRDPSALSSLEPWPQPLASYSRFDNVAVFRALTDLMAPVLEGRASAPLFVISHGAWYSLTDESSVVLPSELARVRSFAPDALVFSIGAGVGGRPNPTYRVPESLREFSFDELGWQRTIADGTSEAADPPAALFCLCSGDTDEGNAPIDVIVAVDSSGSMSDNNALVREQLDDFVQSLEASGRDTRLILLSDSSLCFEEPLGAIGACAGGVPSTQSGGVWGDSRAPAYVHLAQPIASNDALVRVLEADSDIARWLRPEAESHLVVITDDDSSLGADEFLEQLSTASASLRRARVHGLVGRDRCAGVDRLGSVYVELAARTGGLTADLCEADPDAFFDGIFGGLVCPPPSPCVSGPELLTNGAFDGACDGTVGAVPNGWTFGEPVEVEWSVFEDPREPGFVGCGVRLGGGTMSQTFPARPGVRYSLEYVGAAEAPDAITRDIDILVAGASLPAYFGSSDVDLELPLGFDGRFRQRVELIASDATVTVTFAASAVVRLDSISLRESCVSSADSCESGGGDNLIVNGDFELDCAGDLSNLYQAGNPDQIPGWDHTDIDWHAQYPFIISPQNRCVVDLSYFTGGEISQAVQTAPGQQYSLTFDVGRNDYGGSPTKTYSVEVAGDLQQYIIAPEDGIRSQTITFVANAATTTVRFLGGDGNAYGATIDNVAVRASCGSGPGPNPGPGPDPDPGPGPGPNPGPIEPPPGAGLACVTPADCSAEAPFCFNIPLSDGRRCNECQRDRDCGPLSGCTYPNPYETSGAYCSLGGFGEGCETDAACGSDAPLCATTLRMGRLWLRNCSQCQTDADCPAATPLCEVDVFVDTHLRAGNRCVAASSLAAGEYCTRGEACASGACAPDPLFNAFMSSTCE